jgi:hypothetical protein
MKRLALLPVTALLILISSTTCTQFPGVNLPGTRLPDVPLPSVEGLLKESPPITTSLADAVTEVPSLDGFEPKTVAPMRELPRGLQGGFLLMPGVWEIDVRSYCLQAGTHAPSRGTGHSYAPLKGPKADIVLHVLQNSALHPEIPQQDVQVLLWAILARTPITQMPRGHQLTAAKLLTPRELLSLERSVLEVLTPMAREKALAALPASARKVFEAENQLREKLTQATEAPFEELERIAVLAGVAPAEPGGRLVQRGRWSYHPDGYFIRFFASSYTQTKIQVYVPDQPFTLEREAEGRILQPPSNTGAPVMFVSSRSLETSGGLAEYGISGSVAVPAGGGQRLGQSSGKPGTGQSPEDKQTRDAIKDLKKYRKGAFKAVKIGGVLTIPTYYFDKIVDFNLTHGANITEALAGDPPRSDYKIIAPVEKIPFTPLKAREGLSPAQAAAMNAFMEASTDLNAKLRAAMISLDRQGGALQAKDKAWSDQQARAVVYYKAESGRAMLVVADRLEGLLKTLGEEGMKPLPVPGQTAKEYQARLQDKGFDPEELAAARQAGMTEAEIASLLKERIAATPEEMTGDPLENLADSVVALRFLGKRFASLPAVAPGGEPGEGM